MSAEEKEEEIKKILENSPLALIYNQLVMYAWMYKAMEKFSPPVSGISSQSIMDKIREFNEAKEDDDDEEEKSNTREIPAITIRYLWSGTIIKDPEEEDEWTDDKIVAEMTLEDLQKELEDAIEEDNNSLAEDDGKEVVLELIHGIGDWHVGRDTDSIWQREYEQNPHPDDEHEAVNPLLEAGDSPTEVGRQMREALERISNERVLQRRFGECDESFRRRVLEATPDYENQDGSIIRGGPNRMCTRGRSGGNVFLAHQRGIDLNYCQRCERVGCTDERMEKTIKEKFCAGFVDKRRDEVPDQDCVICNNRMDSPEQFPIGFPDKWKACCYCVEVWSIMSGLPNNLVGMARGEVEAKWKKYRKKMEEVFTL